MDQVDERASIQKYIEEAYDALKDSDAETALKALQEALKLDFEQPEALYAMKCVNWWLDRFNNLDEMRQAYERGGFILAQWKPFYKFLDRIGGPRYDPCQYALKRFVYSQALLDFEDMAGEGANGQDPVILLQIGRCYKGAGNFEEALRYLSQAVRLKREDGEALAELADVNALLGDERAAKVLFREAFFLDAQSVDLRSMESELIIRLAEKAREKGYEGQELAEWIPVYGCLLGVFSVKRELKPVELGRLKESTLALENELQSESAASPAGERLLKPRLINRYFWLIDYYANTRADPGAVEEIMLKIKILDPIIYEQYRMR